MAKEDFDTNLDKASKELDKVTEKVQAVGKKGPVPDELWKEFETANEKYRNAIRNSYK